MAEIESEANSYIQFFLNENVAGQKLGGTRFQESVRQNRMPLFYSTKRAMSSQFLHLNLMHKRVSQFQTYSHS